jgi:hypothetical protein
VAKRVVPFFAETLSLSLRLAATPDELLAPRRRARSSGIMA